MEDVRAALDGGADPTKAVQLLTQAWVNHVGITESDDGLLAEITLHAPHLNHRCDTLRTEHADIDKALHALGPSAYKEAVIDVLDAIERHRHRGAELVYDAYNVDIATGD